MKGKYSGTLCPHDPLHGYLSHVIRDKYNVRTTRPNFKVFELSSSNEVYGYQEKTTNAQVICKFYGPTFGSDRNKAELIANKEYNSLELLRRYGFRRSPHHVIRPLGVNRDLNCALVLEYFSGEQFGTAIQRAIHQNDAPHLFFRLKALAYFLATMHNRTANGETVDFTPDSRYLDDLIKRLQRVKRIQPNDAHELRWLRDGWYKRPIMWHDQQVLIHGDATPANFIFGNGMEVAALDLERMQRGDRLFDVGRITGELQHAFLHATGNKYKAEPFIGHFLWEYSSHFPDRHLAFASITARNPYYMGLNMLRIARNAWISDHYAGILIAQAKKLLQAS